MFSKLITAGTTYLWVKIAQELLAMLVILVIGYGIYKVFITASNFLK